MRPSAARLGLLAGIALLALLAGTLRGSSPLPLAAVWQALGGSGDELSRQIVWGLRAPRVFSAFACGGLLAVAGLLMQALTRNPLADPYILGASGGAAVAGLAAVLLGSGWAAMHVAAFGGALLAMALALGLALRPGGWRGDHLLLTGIAVSAACGAAVTLLLSLAPAADIRGMLFWLMGDLSHATSALLPCIVLVCVSLAAAWLGPQLDVLGLGDLKARSLGVDVARLQLALCALAALATAVAVLAAGTIGFVGLVIPHLLRLWRITAHRALVPAAALGGGALLTLADLAARTAIAPRQLPVGALTALLGVPLLILLLRRDVAR